MDETKNFGKLLVGEINEIKNSYENFIKIPVDKKYEESAVPLNLFSNNVYTIKNSTQVSSYGTFNRKKTRTLHFKPYDKEGWWFQRSDLTLPPVKLSIQNVNYQYTSGVNNIVLKTKENDIYFRLIEHIAALKSAINIDSLLITADSDDPPLLSTGSLNMINALEQAEKTVIPDINKKYFTVKETVSAVWPSGAFLIFSPNNEINSYSNLDCAIDFQSAIGIQRIQLPLTYEHLKLGSVARTNSTLKKAILSKTAGRFIKGIKDLGYNSSNVLIAGKKKYFNTPRLIENKKSLEAIWHRAVLDLPAVIAMADGVFKVNVISYKAGHREDIQMMKFITEQNLFEEIIK